MTCMKQEFCIHEKYCQRHIGQNFDSCILFSRNSKPITNEEYLRSRTTEQLAEFIAYVCYGLLDDVWSNDGDTSCDYRETEKNYWVEWLKQPHTPKE